MALTFRSLIPSAWRPKPRFEDNTPIGQPIQGLIQSYVSPWAETGIQITPQNARESPTVFACVRLISNSIARMEWRVMVNDEDGSPRPMPKHPLWRILNDEPNAYMSGFTFRESMLTDCLLFGNAYAYIERDASARPVALQKLRPDLVFVSRGPDNAPIYHYQSGTNGGARVLQGFDVFHLSGAGSDGLLGDPPIYLAREVIGLEIVTTRFVSRFFMNGGRPAGALTTPGTLSPEALDRLRQSWQQLHAGADNAGRVAILEAGMKFEKMAIDPDEAQLLELRSYCREQIAAAFGVPPHMVGDNSKQSYASAEQADIEYVKHCLGSWASRLEREVARKLIVNEPDTTSRISFDELLRGDMGARFSSYNTALQAGFLSINEVRAREGLPPVDGGNQIRVPMNQQTLDPDADVPGSIVKPNDTGDAKPQPKAEPKPEAQQQPKSDSGDAAQTPLNGAQIQAAQQILLAVTAKQLAGPAAEALLIAVGMTPAQAQTMVSSQATINPQKVEPVPEATKPATEADAKPDAAPEAEDNSAGAVRLARRGGNVSTDNRDCGTGAGGFQPGNDCGKEDGSGSESDKGKDKGGNKDSVQSYETHPTGVEHVEHSFHRFYEQDGKFKKHDFLPAISHKGVSDDLMDRPPKRMGKGANWSSVTILSYSGNANHDLDRKYIVEVRSPEGNTVLHGGIGADETTQLLTEKEAIKLYDYKVNELSGGEAKPAGKPSDKKPKTPTPTKPEDTKPTERPKRRPEWKGEDHATPSSTDSTDFDEQVGKFAADGEFKGFTHLTKAELSRFRGKIHPRDPHWIRVAEKLAERPAHHIAGLGRTVTGRPGKYLRGSTKTGKVLGMYKLASKDIEIHAATTVGPRGHAAGLEQGTFEHEIGHHVHMRLTSRAHDEWEAISKNGDTAKISAYARTCTGEHFAEAYRAWHKDAESRKRLRELEPEAAAFMERLDDPKSPAFLPGEATGDFREAQRRYGTPKKRRRA